MYKLFFILLAIVLLSVPARAQDAHLSMYDDAPLFLNPAMTGVVNADFRIHGQYRTQWKSVNYKPYSTYLLSFDMPVKKWGFGVQLKEFRAGKGNYNALQGLLSVAYNTAIDQNKHHMLSFGVQAGLIQKSLEYPLLSFDNQYTYENGGHFDTSLPSGESFNQRTIYLPSVNAGVMYYYAKENARFNPFIGISAFNLVHPKESFQGMDNKLPLRYYLHVGTRINISETFYLIPKVLIMHQEKFNEQTAAVELGYYLKNSKFYVLGDLIYRNKDAAIIAIGGKWNQYMLKFAYDINTSSLSKASTGRGGFEISFTYTHKKTKNNFTKICPRL